jgi:hypothetical protein
MKNIILTFALTLTMILGVSAQKVDRVDSVHIMHPQLEILYKSIVKPQQTIIPHLNEVGDKTNRDTLRVKWFFIFDNKSYIYEEYMYRNKNRRPQLNQRG